MDYKVEEWTQELPGLRLEESPWGSIAVWDIPGEVIRAEEKIPAHDNWHHEPNLFDTEAKLKFDEIGRYSDDFIKRHGYERINGRYRSIEPNQEKIAVFCHGRFGLTWIAHLLEIPFSLMWSGFWLPPASVTTILFDERSKKWAVPRS